MYGLELSALGKSENPTTMSLCLIENNDSSLDLEPLAH